MGVGGTFIGAALTLLAIAGAARAGYGSHGGGGRVLLQDLSVFTAKQGQMTTGRRSAPVPQMKCIGGSAGCSHAPTTMQCYNRGYDGYDVQWECKGDMDNAYRFGDLTVVCEG